MRISDPCDGARLEEDFSGEVFLYAAIGAESKTYEMLQPHDDISLNYDDDNDPDQGYIACEERESSIMVRAGVPGSYQYIAITGDYAKVDRD